MQNKPTTQQPFIAQLLRFSGDFGLELEHRGFDKIRHIAMADVLAAARLHANLPKSTQDLTRGEIVLSLLHPNRPYDPAVVEPILRIFCDISAADVEVLRVGAEAFGLELVLLQFAVGATRLNPTNHAAAELRTALLRTAPRRKHHEIAWLTKDLAEAAKKIRLP